LIGASQADYNVYHTKIIEIEEKILAGEFEEAQIGFQSLDRQFDFLFLRDLKIAAQVAAYNQDSSNVFYYLKKAQLQGWKIKHIKKTPLLTPYVNKLTNLTKSVSNPQALAFVDSLFHRDQKMALKAFVKVREKARQKFYDNQFAPHSNLQLQILINWLENGNPWPGEKEVGNGFMASTIVSHHNSISQAFNTTDTLFYALDLDRMLEKGELSPFHYALMHDWRNVVSYDYNTAYGYVGRILNTAHLHQVEENRARIGLRSIQLRNRLVELEEYSQFKFFLPGSPWQSGAITISKKK
jgi:hypothetical protein